MSVDAHELERAALQKKDREQLLAIAKAMGGKPSSRARKDQIIDGILALAGVPAPAGATSVAAEPPAGSAGARRGRRDGQSTPARTEVSLFADGAGAQSGSNDRGASGNAQAGATGGVTSPGNGHAAGSVMVADQPGGPPATVDASAADASSEDGQVAASASGANVDMVAPRPEREPVGVAPARGAADSGRTSDAIGRAGDGGAQAPPGSTGGTSARPAPSSARFVFSPEEPGPGLDDVEDFQLPSARRRPERGDAERADAERAERDRDHDRSAREHGDRDRGDGDRMFEPGAGNGLVGQRPAGDEGTRPGDVEGQEGGGRRRRRRGKDRNRGDERPERAEDRREAVPGAAPRPAGEELQLQDQVQVAGYLDLRDEGYGFLRVRGVLPSKEDVYVPSKFVRQFSLRKGDHVAGSSRPAGRGEKNPALLRVDRVNGDDPEKARTRPRFEDLTPLFPDEKLRLELRDDPTNMTARIVDLIAPIGKGQRGLIVSPPKAGKTTIMKQIAQSIETNNPEVKLIVLLVDERPEEVTDMRRSVRGEVVASTFDRPSDEHTAVAELTIERAKRMVEMGEDVVIILDGITRLARAYNLAAPATGRIMSGGIDTGALYPPKRFFGAARNVEEGGSLTILATALVETGSKMDEVIFEEFKGTGNMELRLDRRMAEKRIYPAIDVDASSTRHEELLFERRQLQMVWKLRRVLSGLAEGNAGLELLIDRMKTFRSNDEFLAEVAKAPSM